MQSSDRVWGPVDEASSRFGNKCFCGEGSASGSWKLCCGHNVLVGITIVLAPTPLPGGRSLSVETQRTGSRFVTGSDPALEPSPGEEG